MPSLDELLGFTEAEDTVTPQAGSFYGDPATGALYEANAHGYLECRLTAKGGDMLDAIKFEDAKDFVLTTRAEWVNDWVDEQIVNPSEPERTDDEPMPWKLWGAKVKEQEKEFKERGISGAQFLAVLGPIEHEHGRTPKAYGMLVEKLSIIANGNTAKRELFDEAPRTTLLDSNRPIVSTPAADRQLALSLKKADEPQYAATNTRWEVDLEGEILTPAEELADLLDLSDKDREKLGISDPQEFQITNEKSADWFVTKIRESQSKCERLAEIAQAALQAELTYQNKMLYRYGLQLHTEAARHLPLKKDGDYRVKNVKYTQGCVFFKKSGGWKCTDRLALQRFIDSLPTTTTVYKHALEDIIDVLEYSGEASEFTADEAIAKVLAIAKEANEFVSPLDNFPVQIVRKFDVKDMIAYAKQGVELPGIEETKGSELSQMHIGGKKAWTLAGLKKMLKLATEPFKLLAQSDEDEVEGEVL